MSQQRTKRFSVVQRARDQTRYILQLGQAASQKSCYDIPPATGRGGYKPSEQQDVVKLEIVDQPVLHEETPQLLSVLPDHTDTNCMEATAEIKLGSALIRISNDIDPALLAQIIRSVGGASC